MGPSRVLGEILTVQVAPFTSSFPEEEIVSVMSQDSCLLPLRVPRAAALLRFGKGKTCGEQTAWVLGPVSPEPGRCLLS